MSLLSLQQPDILSFNGNVSENWKKWKQRFNLYLSAVGIDKKQDSRIVSLLLTCIGGKGIEIFNTFTFSDDSEKTYDNVIKRFDDHFVPKSNVTYLRHLFFNRSQAPGETVDQFVTDLRLKSKGCEFETLTEGLIKDRLVCGIINIQIKERLLREHDLTLDKALQICHAAELSSQQMKELEGSSTVHAVNYKKKNAATSSAQTREGNSTWISKTKSNHKGKTMQNNVRKPCSRCGTSHDYKQCPAFGRKCHKCNKLNHFQKMCLGNRKINTVGLNSIEQNINFGVRNLSLDSVKHNDNCKPNIHDQNAVVKPNYRYNLFVGNLNLEDESVSEWRAELTVRQKTISFKVDTGAQINVISKSVLNELGLGLKILQPVKATVTTFSGERVNVLGKCYLNCTYQSFTGKLYFYVVDFKSDNILGLGTCTKLNIVQRVNSLNKSSGQVKGSNIYVKPSVDANQIVKLNNSPELISEFSDLFDGSIGCVKNTFKIVMKDNVKPVVSPPRKVPFALLKKLKCELDKMESLNIIEKVVEPTDWVSPIVITQKKNGDIRICLDPKNLNEQMRRSHYQLPSIDSVASKLAGAKHFSILDASAGFWMIPLDEESSLLCTFSTPYGRFKFKRLPFGIRCAPEAFHRIVSQTFDNLPGVDSYLDDILVWGSTKAEHDLRLRDVLTRARESGFKFNPNKCEICVTSVKYLGHVFTPNGMEIDASKVEAVRKMPSPTCKKDLERFLGMTNYLSKFIPRYSERTALLRDLLKKENVWIWDENTEKAYVNLKDVLCKSPVLGFFDCNKPVTLNVDASSVGLGGTVFQDGKPIAYFSKSLTENQTRFAQIEKEMLAITVGCERFHQYLYNKSVIVETDHKPLESLFKKPLYKVPMRLQRMMLRLQPYELVVKYKPGKLMYLSDTLSRASVRELSDDFDEELECHVNMLVQNLPISDFQMERFVNETKNDQVLNKLILYVKEGWPSCKNQVDENVRVFWNYRDEISVTRGLVFKNDKIIVPQSLQKEMLKRIHEGHLGIERCKQRAREVMFWPSMNAHITELVNNCLVCKKYQNCNTKEPMMSYDIPGLPWEHVAIDLFTYKNADYLLIVDFYSNFIEICKLPDIRSETIVIFLKSVFARHGIPKMLTSDNGRQLVSEEFKAFLNSWDIKHNTSSPYYPKSNGLAERSVQTVKKLLYKCDASGQDPYLALLNLRNSPRGNLPSPAEMLMSRKLNCRLPMSHKLLNPKCVNPSDVKSKIFCNKQKSKEYYDRNSKPLSKLRSGQNVMFKKNPSDVWKQGSIDKPLNNPRSYIVNDNNGNIYRRNRCHILPVQNTLFNELAKKSNVTSPVCKPRIELRNEEANDKSPPVRSSNICNGKSEEDIMRSYHNYVTRYGRTVRNPKSVFDK